jgi:hypothetical protein
MRIWLRVLCFGAVLLLGVPIGLPACDCLYPGRPCKAFAQTPYIFAGRVASIITAANQSERIVAFQVESTYRGPEGNVVTSVVTGFGGGDCGYGFKQGERYLVYANEAHGRLFTSICSRTRLLADANDDLEYFSKRNDPAHGAGIEGWIDEMSRGPDANVAVKGPLRSARVRIDGVSGGREPFPRWDVTTDDYGRFSVWGLPAGTYRVTPRFPTKFVPWSETAIVERNSCKEIRFLATPASNKAAP